jgi:hypothetical protein
MADTEVVVCAYGDMGKSEIDKRFEMKYFLYFFLN